jgi:hypothetical protein
MGMTRERGTPLVQLRAQHASTMLRAGREHATAMGALEHASAMPWLRTTLDERQPLGGPAAEGEHRESHAR